ncbi:MAG TPA: hypothetical protein DCX07_01100 [Phycisphaerales bacterium]|nr:hypothetical protein [Phycisphaerales bacterium]
MLAIGFLIPGVLAAAWACALPVIIHLILRTKPRKMVFPALRFVRKTHQANISKLRLKHLLLLLMRMAAIVLVATLFARAQQADWRASAEFDQPVAAAIVVDNSGSMDYRGQKGTSLGQAKSVAEELLAKLPGGSRVAVVATATPDAPVTFHSDLRLAGEAVQRVEQTAAHSSLTAALARATALLSGVDIPRKVVYVLTDMTAQAWRDVPRIAEDTSANFAVVQCGGGEAANRALGAVELVSSAASRSADIVVQTTVASVRLGGDVKVQAELGGKALDAATCRLAQDGWAEVALTVRPQTEGVVHGRIALVEADFLALDNERFFTLHVGPPPEVLIVREAATVGAGDETTRLMSFAIAPPGAEGWVLRRTVTTGNLDAQNLTAVRLIVLADVAALSETQWRRKEEFVRAGGRLWIVAGSLMSVASYNAPDAQRVLPAPLKPLEDLPEAMGWNGDDLRQPMLRPLRDETSTPLGAMKFHRRFAIDPAALAPDAAVAVRYADGVPAILTRKLGDGLVLMWNFSPARGFSNLSDSRNIHFPILALHTARSLTERGGESATYTWGQTVSLPLPKGMTNPRVTVRRPGQPAGQTVAAQLLQRVVTLVADAVGPWDVTFTEGAQAQETGFSVNADPSESDLSPADLDAVRRLFPADRLTVATGAEDLVRASRAAGEALDLSTPVLLALLVLMTAESFFANRFYRTPAPTNDVR